MSWARLDDRFASHPKVRKLRARYGVEAYVALGWWFLQLADTFDGTLDRETSRIACPEIDPDLIVPLLLDVGLLDFVAEGRWAIHDWADYQTDTTLQRLGGKARAATGARDPKTGRLLPTQPAGPAGHQQATSLPSSPDIPASPRAPAREGVKDPNPERVATLMSSALAALSAPRPAPKPVRAKR